MTIKLLTEQHLEFLRLTEGCTGSSETTLVKCIIVGNHVSRQGAQWLSGSVVEYLTRDQRAAGSSLTGVTVLCP